MEVTSGIISGVNRIDYGEFKLVQADLSSSMGFSGGPLINSEGKVIGMNSYKSSEPGSEGLTFSIKAEDLKYAIRNFEKYHKIKRAYIGIEVYETLAQRFDVIQEHGIKVSSVVKDSPADRVGIRIDDRIMKINDNTDQIFELWREFWQDRPSYEIRLKPKIEADPELVYVAEADGVIIGTVIGGDDGWWGWIYRVAVSPEFQKRGVAITLVNEMLSRLKARGVNYINLIVAPANAKMLSLLNKFGYMATEDRRLCIRIQ